MEKNKWNHPDNLDALTASPEHHTLLMENEHVRVLRTFIPPGERTNVHTHRNSASLYIISSSDFVRYDAEGNVMLDSRKNAGARQPGTAVWSDPLAPHSLENVGNQDLHVVSVELKNNPL